MKGKTLKRLNVPPVIAAVVLLCGVVSVMASGASAARPPGSAAASAYNPINNDCSAGYVAFTFDDGPDTNTPAVVQTLVGLNLRAAFFVTGNKVTQAGIADEIANGFSVQVHGWDHSSFTGASTGTQALTDDQIRVQLDQTAQAIVAAGGPLPTLYRPPFGDISAHADLVARNDTAVQAAGYRIVMPWGSPTANIVDSRDWTGISSAKIAQNVTQGYTLNNNFYPGIKDGSIVSMHDGEWQTTLNTIGALQTIVDYMNAKHLCSTGTIRPDATGGQVPPPAPPEPTTSNLVQNASLEAVRQVNTPAAEPVCFQQAGASVTSNIATWSLTSDAHSGSIAERVDVTSSAGGDRKLVLTLRQSEASCLAAVTPGRTYSMWVWYKGSWVDSGSGQTKVSIATYYRSSSGSWVYWQGSPLVASTSAWNLAYFTSAPLPSGATAVSFGLAISGVGTLTTDDYSLAMN